MAIINFGGNVHFKPRHLYQPATEEEVLAILDWHAHGKVRVVGALHSWNPAIESEDALIDLRHFDGVEIEHDADGAVWVNVGGGCRIKRLLHKLHHLAGVTLPTVGLVAEQTIAGAISTATHGSGRASLSHYVAGLRVAAFDAAGKACVYEWNGGAELEAARCALGCMGIILRVRFKCVPRYDVAETIVPCATLDDVLAAEDEYPLQQFYLVPHLWSYFAQRRRVSPGFHAKRSIAANWYRAWWFFNIDVGLHLVIKTVAAVLRSPALTRFFFRQVLSRLILTNRTIIDHAERMLVMRHELFKHLEIEIFVPARHVRAAAAFVQKVLQVFAGAEMPGERAELESVGMADELERCRGSFTHHYPITFRRVLPDDTMISMTSGAGAASYAISFITYVEPRDRFYDLASFLARSMTQLFEARLHWGKYFPLANAEIEAANPRLSEFRAWCRQVDPNGVFRNAFTDRVLVGPDVGGHAVAFKGHSSRLVTRA
jgi:FAD/FMN-containing dehydrogenase